MLLRVNVCAVLVLPTARLEKARLEGETLAAVVAMIPERAIVWVLAVALSVTVAVGGTSFPPRWV